MRRLVAVVLAAGVLAARTAWAGGGDALPVPGGLLETLEKLGIAFDADDVRRASTEAILHLVDPRSILIDAPADGAAAVEAGAAARRWPGGVGHIVPSGGAVLDGACIEERLRAWAADDAMQGAVLDLRGVSGVDLGCVLRVAGLCLGPDVTLARRIDRRGQESGELKTRGEALGRPLPLILLVNGETAGAAEALAAFLKGRPGVMLLGRRTAGDAFARERVAVGGGLEAYLATASIRLEGGADYAERGVEADIEMDAVATEDELPSDMEDGDVKGLLSALAGDEALRRAVDIVLGVKTVRMPGAKAQGTSEAAAAVDAPANEVGSD